MKTEKEIKDRITNLKVLRELYFNGDIPYRLWRNKETELQTLQWIMGEIEIKNENLKKKLNFFPDNSYKKAYEYLVRYGKGTANELFSDYTASSHTGKMKDLMNEYPVIRKGKGKKGSPYVYYLKEEGK